MQAQFQNAARLFFRQPHRAFGRHGIAIIIHKRQQHTHIARRPIAVHQGGARGRRIGAFANDANDLIQIGDRNRQANQQMPAFPRLRQAVAGPAQNHLLTEGDEGHQRVLEPHLPRPAFMQGHEIHREGGLQLRHAVKLVQHHFRGRIALQFNDDAHPRTVAFVAQIGNAFNCLGTHQFGDFLKQRGLIDLVGNFSNRNQLAITAQFLNVCPRTQRDRTTPGFKRGTDAGTPQNHRPGRKIRPRHDLHQLFQRERRIGNQRQRRIQNLSWVMRRDIGGHANRNAARAIDQQIGEGRRQNPRFIHAFIIIRLEIHRVFVNTCQQCAGCGGKARFGVAHRRRRIAINRTKIPLPINQGQTHGKGLRHTHQRIINRSIAMRMVFTHHIANHARRFAIGLVSCVAGFLHGKQDAPMDRLQPIAHIGQCPRHDHAHRVIEVGTAHFLLNGDRGRILRGLAGVLGVAHA